MQKLLSIAIPCYNSAAYMRHAVDTLLPGGDEVEILIVDDGSVKDETPAIADELEAAHPGIVRAIHQENGGHGCAVMTGLKNATGLYFKVVDSDDWVDEEAYPKVLAALRTLRDPEKQVDLFLANYIYDKVGVEHKHVVRYTNALPTDRTFTWDEVGTFRAGQYILMHSAIYRTQLLRDCGLELPKHTFYVDNIYVYQPLTAVQKMYYMDVDLYHYFIGRDDQSVQEQVMIKRIDQQLRVNYIMAAVDLTHVDHPRKQAYMTNYLEIICAVSSVTAVRSGTPENLAKKDKLWEDIKAQHPDIYAILNKRIIGRACQWRSAIGRRFLYIAYSISQKIFGFN